MAFFEELKVKFIRKHIKDKLLRKMSLATTTWTEITNDPHVTAESLLRQYELMVDLIKRDFNVVSPSWKSIFVMDYVMDSLSVKLVEKIFNSVRPKGLTAESLDDIECEIRKIDAKLPPVRWMMWNCFLPLHLYALEIIIEKHPASRDRIGRLAVQTT